METEVLTGGAGGLDFSLLALFLRATLTVKIVMIMLVLASFWSWAIIFQKHLLFAKTRRTLKFFLRAFWASKSLDALYEQVGSKPRNAAERIFCAAIREWRRSFRPDRTVFPGAPGRIDRVMDTVIAKEAEKLESGLAFLATVGATSPFIGLFGTVWGIKNAFEEIAIAQNTNLAVVAPGIAEALMATGLGLLAAIPAVIFYNKLSNDRARIEAQMDYFADEFSMLVTRQMEK